MKLLNCYLPVFRLGYEFTLYPENFADYSLLHETCIEMLKSSALAAEREHDKYDCDEALFAVAVWLDEKILCSKLPCVAQWRGNLLQSQLFQTCIGGELFFEHLENVATENIALSRVYLFCLLTGFHGKYTLEDKVLLEGRIDEAMRCIPDIWRKWPNDAPLAMTAVVPELKMLTLWQNVTNNRWSWLIIPTGVYGVMLLSGFVYFS